MVLVNIWKEWNNFDVALVLSQSPFAAVELKGLVKKLNPSAQVRDACSVGDVAAVETLLTEQFSHMRDVKYRNGKEVHALVILDGVSVSNTVTVAFRNLVLICRQAMIGVIFTIQDPSDIAPGERSNMDVFFIQPHVLNPRRIYDSCCGIFPTFAIYDKVRKSVAQQNACMVVDNLTRPKSVEETIYWWK